MRVLPLLLVAADVFAAGNVSPKEPCDAVQKTAHFSVYFERVELEKLVQTVSDATCKTFIVGDNVKGKISIVGPENGKTELTADQFYVAFLAALDVNGLAVVGSGRFVRIVEKTRGRQNLIPLVLDEQTFPARDEMVTRLFRLKHAELDVVKTALTQFLTVGADLVAVPPDLLLVSDLGSNLLRLEPLVTALDVERSPVEQLKVLTVKNADAADVADKMTRLLTPKTAKPGETLTVLNDERTNRLLVVASPALLERAQSLLEQLDISAATDGRAHVYKLKHADAKEIATTLEAVTQGAGKPRGAVAAGAAASSGVPTGEVRITSNESLNALVIVASGADYGRLLDIIEELDVPTREVFIETVIMEVNVSRDQQVGASMHAAVAPGGLPLVFGSQPTGSPSSLDLTSLVGMGGLLAGIQGPVLAGVKKALGIDIPEFGLVLQAMMLSSDVNVLSTPHILTTDNKEAEMTVGQKVPFQVGAVNPGIISQLAAAGGTAAATAVSAYGSNITREPVELKLTVKPHIGDADSIRLEVNQKTEEIAGSNTYGQITSTRSQKTTVIARDNETIVLGGIMQDREIESVSKTPVLGDIPILGNLFRHSQTIKTKVNLLVFLTPHIIHDPRDVQRLLDTKLAERKRLLEQFYGAGPQYESTIDFGRKPGPLSVMARAVKREEQRPENGGKGAPDEKVYAPAQ